MWLMYLLLGMTTAISWLCITVTSGAWCMWMPWLLCADFTWKFFYDTDVNGMLVDLLYDSLLMPGIPRLCKSCLPRRVLRFV